jgi:glycosyltransferase involved in cell wall biosynthesis
MEQNLISVIMPVYKTEESHLRKAIESVINQSYRKLEIVLVDDGSPDQCGAICDAYAGTDNRIRVIHKKNGGVSSARNCGLETVTGDYIFFVDSDDTLKGNAIEVLFAIVQKTNADIVICSCKHVKEKNDDNAIYDGAYQCLKTVESAEAIKNLSYNIHVFDELEPTAVWGKLYKKSAVQNLRFNEKMNVGEDFVFNYFAICKAKVVTYCNLKLYNYNFVETSLMNNKIYSPKLMRSFEELVKFAESQKNSEYFDEVIVRSVNVAFTIYLKTPEKQSIEKNEIEEYIVKYRSSVLTNTKTNLKIRVALVLSTISFKLVRWVFFKTKKLQIS